jgi:hypothetical protein
MHEGKGVLKMIKGDSVCEGSGVRRRQHEQG